MATIIVRNLDEETKRHLQVLAAMHGRSMEAEARKILSYHLGSAPRLMPESLALAAPDPELHLAADHGSDSEQDLPQAARTPRGMGPREAILCVNRELGKLGMSDFALREEPAARMTPL